MFLDAFEFLNRNYCQEAAGWNGGVYTERKSLDTKVCLNDVKEDMIDGIMKVPSKVWTETEETGFGVYTYIEGPVFCYPTGLSDWKFAFTVKNPASQKKAVGIFVNDMYKCQNEELEPGEVKEITFTINSIEEVTEIQLYVQSQAEKREDAADECLELLDLQTEKMPSKQPRKLTTIYLASDSTVQSYDEFYYPQTGWGQVFHRFFKGLEEASVVLSDDYCYPQCHTYTHPEIIIENRSIGARSARSFIGEGKWDALLDRACPGDYCFMQWAHNDATAIRPNRYVAAEDFPSYLIKYSKACKARGIHLVLVTPVSRRNCGEHDGHFELSFEKYRDAMIQVGKEEKIPVIDLCKKSCDLLNEIGVEESKLIYLHAAPGAFPEGAYAGGVSDNVHLQEYGAMMYSKIVAESILCDEEYPEMKALKSYIKIPESIDKPLMMLTSAPANPEVPQNFAMQELHIENKTASFLLTWSDVPGAKAYNVYRRGSVDFQFFPLRTVTKEEKENAVVLPFKLPASDVYRVHVCAVFESGEGEPSRTIEFRA